MTLKNPFLKPENVSELTLLRRHDNPEIRIRNPYISMLKESGDLFILEGYVLHVRLSLQGCD